MLRKMSFGLLSLTAISLLGFGCATKSYVSKQISPVQSQISAMTEEMARLDNSVQDMRNAIQNESNRASNQGASAGAGAAGGIYRTPSGFQLPSLKIQQALKNAGYYQGNVDGKVGSGTEAAIRAFQKDNGLHADGVCGRQTWQKLKVYLSTVK